MQAARETPECQRQAFGRAVTGMSLIANGSSMAANPTAAAPLQVATCSHRCSYTVTPATPGNLSRVAS
jgi:hypothetical protein